MNTHFINDERFQVPNTHEGAMKAWETRRAMGWTPKGTSTPPKPKNAPKATPGAKKGQPTAPSQYEFGTKEEASKHVSDLRAQGNKGMYKISERRGRFIVEKPVKDKESTAPPQIAKTQGRANLGVSKTHSYAQAKKMVHKWVSDVVKVSSMSGVPQSAFNNEGNVEGAIKGWATRRGGAPVNVKEDDIKKLKLKAKSITHLDRNEARKHEVMANRHLFHREDRIKEARELEKGSTLRNSIEREARLHHMAAIAHLENAAALHGTRTGQTGLVAPYRSTKNVTFRKIPAVKPVAVKLKKEAKMLVKDLIKDAAYEVTSHALITSAAALGAATVGAAGLLLKKHVQNQSSK